MSILKYNIVEQSTLVRSFFRNSATEMPLSMKQLAMAINTDSIATRPNSLGNTSRAMMTEMTNATAWLASVCPIFQNAPLTALCFSPSSAITAFVSLYFLCGGRASDGCHEPTSPRRFRSTGLWGRCRLSHAQSSVRRRIDGSRSCV